MEHQDKERLSSRVLQALIYLSLLGAGILGLFGTTSSFSQLVGMPLAQLCGLFALLGSVLGSISVIAGAYWLERVAIIFTFTSLTMYGASLVLAGASTFGVWIALGFAIVSVKRIYELTSPPRHV